MPRSVHSLLRAALGTCVVPALLAGCTSSPSANLSMPPAAVKLQTVQLESVDQTTAYMATMKSRKSAILQPRVSGTISKILVTVGQKVAAGTPLVEIDPEKEKASVASLESATRSMTADRQSAEQTLRSLQATLTSKEANVKFLQQEVTRYTWLSSQGAVAKEQLDNYTMQLRAAQGDLKSVEAQIEAQKSTIAKSDNVMRQTAESARGEKVQLRYYTVVAPFAGTVGDIPLRIGEYVDSTTKITTVTQNVPLEAYISVPAEKAAALYKGMVVKLADGAGAPIGDGSVFFISPVAEDTQSVVVKALYPNNDEKLRSNQTVSARVVWQSTQSIMVPTFSVAHVSGQDFVFVADGHGTALTAKQKPVVLGDIVGNAYVVKSGLQPGDRLVTSGVQSLVDGAPIAPQS
jgi:multidrug efflux pump subunit AcrA (membrane-fusion protein)